MLAGLLIAGVIEPLASDWSQRTRIFGGLIVFVVNFGVLLIVLDQRWERWLAFFSDTMIKPEVHHLCGVRFRPAARPDEFVDTETSDRGVRTGRLL